MNTPLHTFSPVQILGGMRTPFEKAFGVFNSVDAVQLGSLALKEAMISSGIGPDQLDEVVFGNVATPANAANIARVIALRARVPMQAPAFTVNRNCGSGMEAVLSGCLAINDGRAAIVGAGGVESMSNIPIQFGNEFQDWLLDWRRKRGLAKFSHLLSLRPSMLAPISALQVGLTDPTCGLNMGETAEILAEEFSISREAQDAFALQSHQRASSGWERGFFDGEVFPVLVEGESVQKDNGIRPNQTMQALSKLHPVFKKGGSVTAGNSSQLTDGACSIVIASDAEATHFGLKPIGTIHAYSVVGLDPKRMGLGPVFAIDQLLKCTKRSLSDFDLFEINEAFAAQVLACLEAMASDEYCRTHLHREEAIGRIPQEKLNVNGGAISLGHPLGASGSRLMLTLLRALQEKGLRHGLASLCIGGGQGMAVWIESHPS
ncbi:thiolase family protein [Planctomicrobium sp. SH668]|uniref:thiolase family protein n=1 Tax=Planctomicrobium sp. SH668 TaxID=3448126 RepID=UPI003F5B4C6C